jgi:hypothetical protein
LARVLVLYNNIKHDEDDDDDDQQQQQNSPF